MRDLRQLDRSCGLLSTLITNFLRDVPNRLAVMQDALRQGNEQALALTKMRQLCVDLQAIGKAKDHSTVGALLAQLVSEFELVRERLMAE